jgi:chromatin structure-remodeling complex subunit RSC1/2
MADAGMTDVAPAEVVAPSDQPAPSIETPTQVSAAQDGSEAKNDGDVINDSEIKDDSEVKNSSEMKKDSELKDDSEIKDESEIIDDSELKDGEDGGEDQNAGADNVPKKKGRRWPKKEGTLDNDVYKALKAVADTLTDHTYTKRGQEYSPSVLFRRIPNKRILPDYHDLIKEPRAISSLKGKIQRKEYGHVKEYVRDFALVVHNAQIYNRPNSIPVKDVKYLEKLFNDEMRKLADEGIVKEEDLVFPDLGEIPYATPEPDVPSEEEPEEEEEEGEGEDDDDEDADDSDEDGPKKRRKGRKSGVRRKDAGEDEDGKGDDQRKKRGRPPKVDTPMEARIKAVLKGIRKPKDGQGALKIRHFDRLPDKTTNPDYYQEIKTPIALDLIKRKAKRKKYDDLDDFMVDIKLMFNNAMAYNEDASEIYQDAAELLVEAQALADAEKAKPDAEFLDEDGRLPLPHGIMQNGENYRVGDWVHIANVNDVTKPIIAQIYRTWQDTDGQQWINACWYYRPEQTVHQHEKHFFEDEVVKTGQYRDHRIDEVEQKCFVMFVTRYSKGRPKGYETMGNIYVCEARYNEEKHRMNKIKTWASCLPDEIRGEDYPMVTIEQSGKVRKVPSPLLYLLKEDSKESNPSEAALLIQWGSADAPPIVGAIYKGQREEGQSPPPEPPRPQSPPKQPIMRPVMQPRPAIMPNTQQQPARASPSMTSISTPQYPGAQASAPAYARQNSYQPQTVARPYPATPQTPMSQQPRPYAPQLQQQLHQPSMGAAHPTGYPTSTPAPVYPRQPLAAAQPANNTGYPAAPTHVQREQDVFVLPDHVNANIPDEIRNQFPQDDQGRMLFFTKPPVDTRSVLSGRSEGDRNKPLSHSARFQEVKAELQRKRKEKADDISMAGVPAAQPGKQNEGLSLPLTEKVMLGLVKAVTGWAEKLAETTKLEYQQRYAENWQVAYDADMMTQQERKRKWVEDSEKKVEQQLPDRGTASFNFKGRNPFAGRYEDDYDPRYGF